MEIERPKQFKVNKQFRKQNTIIKMINDDESLSKATFK